MRITNFSNWFNVTTKIGVGYVLLMSSARLCGTYSLDIMGYVLLTLSTNVVGFVDFMGYVLLTFATRVCGTYVRDTVMWYLLSWHHGVCGTYVVDTVMWYLLSQHHGVCATHFVDVGYVILTLSTSWGMCYLLCWHDYVVFNKMNNLLLLR